jgi:hypothetical protein
MPGKIIGMDTHSVLVVLVVSQADQPAHGK